MRFHWHTFDLSSFLFIQVGDSWEEQVIHFALQKMNIIKLQPNSTTSREKEDVLSLKSGVVNGQEIKQGIPWLYNIYRTHLRELAEFVVKKPVVCANNDLYGININIQVGDQMRYECHVDSNPVQGMLYATSHRFGEGGELVVANEQDVFGIDEVDKDCTIIHPKSGRIIFFDARKHSHYVRPLVSKEHFRIAIAMNFYTEDSPESTRPANLSKHLGLE
jgi:2OG-Fe(II) oxygenase superfamily